MSSEKGKMLVVRREGGEGTKGELEALVLDFSGGGGLKLVGSLERRGSEVFPGERWQSVDLGLYSFATSILDSKLQNSRRKDEPSPRAEGKGKSGTSCSRFFPLFPLCLLRFPPSQMTLFFR